MTVLDRTPDRGTAVTAGLPAGHHSANGFIAVRGASALIDFLIGVFDATEATHLRTPDRDGSLIHAEVRIGDATVMLCDAKPDWPFTPALTQVYVSDAQVVLDRAVRSGGRVVTEVSPFYNGLAIARFEDPWHNLWWLFQPTPEMTDRPASSTEWHDREPSYVYTSLMAGMRRLGRLPGGGGTERTRQARTS